MGKVAIAGDTNRVDDARKSRCFSMRHRKPGEECGRKWEDHEFKRCTDAVDHHALQPLFDVVAVRSKDEVLVAEERDRDGDWLGDKLRQVDDQGQGTGRHERAKHMHGGQEKDIGEERIEAAYGEEADHLARREDASQSGEWSICRDSFGRVRGHL